MGNLKQDLSHDTPCHPRACAIQGQFDPLKRSYMELDILKANLDCLTKNSYKEEKCQAQIDALYECCNAFYQEQGDQASVVSCPKAQLLRLKMKQRAEATKEK